jgi:ABC-type multidrug transport system fused ATPase/permease subunit
MEYQTVVLHNMQSGEQAKAIKNSALIPWWAIRADGLNNLGYQLLYLCFVLIELLIYIFLGYQALTSSTVSIAQIVILTQVIRQMWRPISILMQEFSQWNKHVSAYISRQKFINTPASILDGTQEYRYTGGHIVIDQLGFVYPAKQSPNK